MTEDEIEKDFALDDQETELQKTEDFTVYAQEASNNILYPSKAATKNKNRLRSGGGGGSDSKDSTRQQRRHTDNRPMSNVMEEPPNDTSAVNHQSLSLKKQLDYIKDQQIKLQQEEIREHERLQRHHAARLEQQASQASQASQTSQPSQQSTYYSASMGSPFNDDTPVPTHIQQPQPTQPNDSQETSNIVSPGMSQLLQHVQNEYKERPSPYDAYLRYIKDQASAQRPSPSSSLKNLGLDSSASESSSSSLISGDAHEFRASNTIPIAFFPGVTSNFTHGGCAHPQGTGASSQYYPHGVSAVPSSSVTPTRTTFLPTGSRTDTINSYDNRSSSHSYAPIYSASTAIGAQPQLVMQSNQHSHSSSPQQFRYPSTLEPGHFAYRTPQQMAAGINGSPKGPDLDRRPRELASNASLKKFTGATSSLSGNESASDSEFEEDLTATPQHVQHAQASPSSYYGSNAEAMSIRSNVSGPDHGTDTAEPAPAVANDPQDDAETARLTLFDYPVVFDPTEEISFVSNKR